MKKSLQHSIKDGAFYASMVGFGESYLSAFGLLLNATSTQIALLGSLPHALAAISQLASSRLLSLTKSRKRLVLLSAFLHGLMYLPITLLAFLGSPLALIIVASIYFILGGIASPAWNSWMGDIVPPKERGSYFGRRNKIVGSITFITFVLGGLILQHLDGSPEAFAFLFMIAGISRMISVYHLSLQEEPPYSHLTNGFDFKTFLRDENYSTFRALVLYLAIMNIAVYISAPFFVPYMLESLGLSYLQFTILMGTSIITKFFAMPLWGQASDQFGSLKVLSIGGVLTPTIPLLWILSPDIGFLVIAQIISGFTWAAYEIAAFNFIFETTHPLRRVQSVSYYNAVNGSAMIIGSVIGSLLLRFNAYFWSDYLYVMFISGILRFIISLWLLPKLREMREDVPHISKRKLLLNVISMMPTMGIMYDIVTIRRRKRKSSGSQHG